MARLPRYFVKGQPQHIIQRGNNREVTFAHPDDYQFYLACLQEASHRNELSVHAYVLMTNHVHILASPKLETSIAKTLQSVGRRYVQYFNHAYQRTGTLWEGRYKATVIDSDQYLLSCMRYIEFNPVRAGLIKHPQDYPWSSCAANAGGRINKLVTPHRLYKRIGANKSERQSAYSQLCKISLENSVIDALRAATNKGWVLGNERFCEKIEKLSGRRSGPKPRGRPKKVNT